eukprot:scaffold279738_cov31-Tisochrysis_lutea.AAC.2
MGSVTPVHTTLARRGDDKALAARCSTGPYSSTDSMAHCSALGVASLSKRIAQPPGARQRADTPLTCTVSSADASLAVLATSRALD